jgi:excisionase family DNA binding protein
MEQHRSATNPEQKHVTPALLSVDDTAHTLGVCPRFIRILAARGELRVVRLGRRMLISQTEISRLVAEGAK